MTFEINSKHFVELEPSNSQLIISHSSIFEDVERRKRKFIPEDLNDEFLKPGDRKA